MATALTSEYTRFTDKCNKVLAGGIVKTFEPNSLTPKISYQDPNKEIPNLTEIRLDETGRAKIYIDGDYRIQVYSRDGVLIEDNLLVEQSLVQRDFTSLSQALELEQQEKLNQFQTQANEVIAQGFYKGFATETALKASLPAVSEMRARADDTRKIWRWNRTSAEGVAPVTGTWTDTGLSDKDIAAADATTKANVAEANAIAYTELKTQGLLDVDLGDALFAKVDSENRPVEVTAPDGRHYLVGLPGSTQELILDNLERVETVESKLPQFDYDELSLVAHDTLGRILFYMRNDNHLFLDHLNDSVQNSINANTSLLSDMTMSLSMTESSAIKSLTKGTFTADSAAILSMKVPATNTMSYIKMNSPYRKDDAFVHPCVIELYKPMRGYKYLMCITPYWGRNPFEENPTIYGSNDQVTWTMLAGFAQPIANPPEIDEPETGEHGYLSDNWWAYDPVNKELYCCYRKGYYANYPNGYSDNDRMQLLYRKTANGLTWSKPTMFTPETLLGVDGQVAPSMIYDQVNNRWVMIYLKSGDWRIYVRFNTELKVEGWTEPQEIGYRAFADANNIRGWHVETKFIGDKLFMLIGDSVNGKYYFAKANDDTFLNWTFSANSVLDAAWTKGAYKGSFLVVPQENGKIKLRMYFTDTGVGRFYSALSPDISIS